MVGDLVRLKLALTRNQITGGRAFWAWSGAVVGACIALGTLVVAAFSEPVIVADLLGAAYITWLIGWIVGPLMSPAPPLRPEYVTMLPIGRHRLAAGLLTAGFVGLASAVTVLLFFSLVVYGARLGIGPLLLALPVAVIQVCVIMLISRAVHVVFGRLARARAGAALNGVVLATVLVLIQSGWMVLVGLMVSGFLEHGFPSSVSSVLRWAPSGWGLVALEAAGNGDWLWSFIVVTSMLVLAMVLLAAWGSTLSAARGERAVVRGFARRTTSRRGPLTRPFTAILGKELRCWWRDPARIAAISAPVTWGVLTGVLPLSFGAVQLLPWAGTLIAVMAAAWLANMYSFDGTGIWITVLTSTERIDVWARQWAYLMVYGPVAIAVTVAFTAWSGLTWAWPWALTAVTATLGVGAGLIAFASVVAPEPGPDPYERNERTVEGSESIGVAFLVFFAAFLLPLPSLGVVLWGTATEHPVVQWAGVLAGITTGVLATAGLGRAAAARLERTAPELLLLMRSGRSVPEVLKADMEPDDQSVATGKDLVLIFGGFVLGPLALFAQGLVPVIFKLTGNHDVRVWFLAMYLPEPWGWLTCIGMVLMGATLMGQAIRLLRRHKPRHD